MRAKKFEIKNVMLILSPLDPKTISLMECYDVASTLRKLGARRADLAMDPRTEKLLSSQHAMTSPVPNFLNVAVGLAQSIFEPTVGHSDVFFLDDAYSKPGQNLHNFSNVGEMFARTSSSGMRSPNSLDGKNLGLVFYLAINGRTSDNEPYDHLVFPCMTKHGHTALGLLDDFVLGKNVGNHGPMVNLAATRAYMYELKALQAL